ncbi:hypothetical protein L345_13244, partial [Ophiophagus hannah]
MLLGEAVPQDRDKPKVGTTVRFNTTLVFKATNLECAFTVRSGGTSRNNGGQRFRDQLLLHSSWDATILPVFHQRSYPKLYVDGPFGSPFEESFNYEVSLCIAGGIGVTPFAAIFNTLLYLWQENRPDFINIQLYLSQTDGIQKIIGKKYQVLNRRLFIGRPQWKLLFNEIAKYNRQKTVGVFCCGPRGISKAVHRQSNRDNPYETRFEYNKESFS